MSEETEVQQSWIGKQMMLDETRSVWVGRVGKKTGIRFVNAEGDQTCFQISQEARDALLHLLLEDCA